MKITLAAALVLLLVSGTLSGQQTQTCNYSIGGNSNAYALSGSCVSESVYFLPNSTNNRLLCSNASPGVSSVNFGAGTYNNSIINCTFESASISSMHEAKNNVISPFGNYSLSFLDNTSNIALGYFFTFVPRDVNGNLTKEWFAALAPYKLAEANFQVINNQEITMAQVYAVANSINYTLPRFGQYLPTNSTWSSPISFALEAEQISKNGTESFNPYWFICPDWGYDVLSYREFNITSNEIYTPFFLKPDFISDVQLPDNTNMYWNFTVRNYSNATHITAYVFSGYQFEPPKLVEDITNFTGSRLSYHEGVKPPGIYQFIGELLSSHNMTYEQANSTSINYAIGLQYCTQYSEPIMIPGTYSMAFPDLTLLDVFSPSSLICSHAVKIVSDNVTINCRGGVINSTNQTVLVQSSQNVTLENCKLGGNAITAYDSELSIVNSTLTANNESNYAFSGARSTIYLRSAQILGYSQHLNASGANISVVHLLPTNSTVPPTTALSNMTANSSVQEPQRSTGGAYNKESVLAATIFTIFAIFALASVLRVRRKSGKSARRDL